MRFPRMPEFPRWLQVFPGQSIRKLPSPKAAPPCMHVESPVAPAEKQRLPPPGAGSWALRAAYSDMPDPPVSIFDWRSTGDSTCIHGGAAFGDGSLRMDWPGNTWSHRGNSGIRGNRIFLLKPGRKFSFERKQLSGSSAVYGSRDRRRLAQRKLEEQTGWIAGKQGAIPDTSGWSKRLRGNSAGSQRANSDMERRSAANQGLHRRRNIRNCSLLSCNPS